MAEIFFTFQTAGKRFFTTQLTMTSFGFEIWIMTRWICHFVEQRKAVSSATEAKKKTFLFLPIQKPEHPQALRRVHDDDDIV